MPLAKIKQEFEGKTVGFGKYKGPLGVRQDIDDLAVIALESGDKSLLNLFEVLPDLATLKKAQTEAKLASIPNVNRLEAKAEPARTFKATPISQQPEIQSSAEKSGLGYDAMKANKGKG